MLSLVVALVAFFITIPIKVVIMGIEITKKTKEKLIDGDKNKQTVFEKITKKRTKENKKENKATQILIKSLKRALLALKFLLNVLRTVVVIFTSVGIFTIFLFAIVLVLVGSTAAFVSMNFGKLDLADSNTKQEEIQENLESDDILGSSTHRNYNQIFGDNSTWLSCCDSMFTWYFANIHTYQKSAMGLDGTGVRGWYTCDLFSNPGIQVGDDCSSFVYACLAYAGFVSDTTTTSAWNSTTFADETNSTLLKYFNPYSPSDYGKSYIPRPGDIMAYSGHVEIIAQVTDGNCLSYSWGSVPRSNPCQRAGDIETFLKHMWSGNEHTVRVIWSLKDGVQTMNNIGAEIIEGTGGGNASSGGITYGGVYSGEDGYHHFEDSEGYEYDFTNEQWVTLSKHFFEDGKDGETIDEEEIEISSHSLRELCDILGIPFPYEEEELENTS